MLENLNFTSIKIITNNYEYLFKKFVPKKNQHFYSADLSQTIFA